MKASTKNVILGSAALAALGMAAGAPDANAATTGVKISATVLAPIQVTATQTLNFGSLTEAGTGTMKVGVDGTGTAGGSVTSIGGTIQAGGFKVQATSGKNVTITAPASATISHTAAAGTMKVTAFELAAPGTTSTTAGALTHNMAAASETGFRLGGTLNVSAGQATGTYTGSATITANYQ